MRRFYTRRFPAAHGSWHFYSDRKADAVTTSVLKIPWRFNLMLTLAVLGICLAFFCGRALLVEHRFALFACLGCAFVIVTPTLFPSTRAIGAPHAPSLQRPRA